MRFSKLFFKTYREDPVEAEIVSHKLMLRAGLIKRAASGIYSYMPLGLKVYRKIENIIREEMDRAGAQELLMPALLPIETYEHRIEKFGSEMFKLKDRNDKMFCLGPTHEEPFTIAVKEAIRSYKDLPVILYQIQTKYRDERRPRFGLQRAREFQMKDAYSFDASWEGLDKSYKAMSDAYHRIFDRLKLDYTPVDADTGAMGGSGSQEFMVKSEVGEANIAVCKYCGYAANEEKAECVAESHEKEELLPIEKLNTPHVKTIDDLTGFLNITAKKFVKTLIYKVGDKFIAVLLRGDREVNTLKLANILKTDEPTLASREEVFTVAGCEAGFVGPIGLKCKIVCDNEVTKLYNFIVGANEKDYHYKNVNYGRDFKADIIADISNIMQNDECPKCHKPIDVMSGIEVGHIFKLGTKYSDILNCKFIGVDGKEQSMIMGCYGIGLGRTLAAIIEQHSDEKGIIWPMVVAPFKAVISAGQNKDEVQFKAAENIYNSLLDAGIDVAFDDRAENLGVKFKDADLIGIPYKIVAGKSLATGEVELIERATNKTTMIKIGDIVKTMQELIKL